MNTAFFASVRNAVYGGTMNQTQVDSINAIGQAWEQYGDDDPRKLAYILATAHHETGGFRYSREIWGPTAQQKRYEARADLGNVQAGDGKKFMGRGFVQLTGRRNYQDWSKRIGLDLLKEPDLVTQPAVAARILVQGSMLGTFTGKKLGDFATFKDMRRVINGTDRADLISGYAEKFLAAIQAAGMGVSLPPLDDIDQHPEPAPNVTTPTAKGHWGLMAGLALLIVVIAALALFTNII